MNDSKVVGLTDYIRYRQEKSKEAYDNACLLAENKAWNAAINRLYYSCFYVVSALLLKNSIKAQTHAGVKSEFAKNFVKEGIITKEDFHVYSDLIDWRQKGDYGDMFDFDEETVMAVLPAVKHFLQIVNGLLEGESRAN